MKEVRTFDEVYRQIKKKLNDQEITKQNKSKFSSKPKK